MLLKFKLDIQSQTKVKIQHGRQGVILKMTSLKSNRLLPTATNNMQTWNKNSQENSNYAPDSMSPTESRNEKSNACMIAGGSFENDFYASTHTHKYCEYYEVYRIMLGLNIIFKI